MTNEALIVLLSNKFFEMEDSYQKAYKWWQEEKIISDEMRVQRDKLSKEVLSLTKELKK